MSKCIIAVDSLPVAGPYSQAIEAGPFIYCSGQLPIDPQTGSVIITDITAATEQVLKNLRSVLNAAGLGLENVVKTTVFLSDMGNFPAMNEVYARFFSGNYPARSAVQVAGLPKGVPVEIEAIAMRP